MYYFGQHHPVFMSGKGIGELAKFGVAV